MKKYFDTVMLMPPKKKILFYSVHSVNIHMLRPNDRKTHANCRIVGADRGGVGAKHRKYIYIFFMLAEQIIKNITLNYKVLFFLKGNFSTK